MNSEQQIIKELKRSLRQLLPLKGLELDINLESMSEGSFFP